VAIGFAAGKTTQGGFAVALGTNAGVTNQASFSTVINSTGLALNAPTTGLFMAPIRNVSTSNALCWDTTTKEVSYIASKTFVIDHPLDKERYLVHACLEGPEAGVYYRGTGEITNNVSTTIDLPSYVSALATNFTVNVTPIYNKSAPSFSYACQVSEVENCSFTIYGLNGRYNWVVYGERVPVNVEPLKSETNVKGDGPYKWI
jgi:hypothetical protein